MHKPATPSHDDRQPFVWRSADQVVIAVAVAIGLAALVVWWVRGGGPAGQLVELDQSSPPPVTFVIDVNTAGWPELAQLPGVGETLARRIVESRQSDGPYRSVEDLRRVNGMGAKTLEKIRVFLKPIETSDTTTPVEPVAPVD